jgi:hypothetical protein
MVDWTKNTGQSLITKQEVTSAPYIVKSSAISVPSEFEANIFVNIGRIVTDALTLPIQCIVEASPMDSGDDQWFPWGAKNTGIAAAEDNSLDGDEAAGQTVISMAATTNFAAGDIIYFKNTTVASSEWSEIVDVDAGNTITIKDGLKYAQTIAATTVYNECERHIIPVQLVGMSRFRLFVNGSQNGDKNFAVEAYYVIGTDIE